MKLKLDCILPFTTDTKTYTLLRLSDYIYQKPSDILNVENTIHKTHSKHYIYIYKLKITVYDTYQYCT